MCYNLLIMFFISQYKNRIKILEDFAYHKGINLGLDRIEELLKKLNNPHFQMPVIHVAGTNGKGSVTIMTSNSLVASGYKVGTFLSPHLVSYNERFLINGKKIENSRFIDIFDKVFFYAREIEDITEFEILTAMAFLLFSLEQVDVVVMEVGLGGRYDATNICRSILTIITPISYDHTAILGDSLSEIAKEKSGIIKKSTPVIIAEQPQKALKEIMKKVEKKECEFKIVNYPTKYKLPFTGIMHRYNASLVIEAVLALRKKGIYIHRKTILNGIARTILPGRVEIVKDTPLTIVDVAHNHHSFKNLVKYLHNDFIAKKKILIIGLMQSKDLKAITEVIKNKFSAIITTNIKIKSSYSSKEIQKYLLGHGCQNVSSAKNVKNAYKKAIRLYDDQSIIVIAGSFVLAGEFYQKNHIEIQFLK